MNIVVGVIVDNTLETSKENDEKLAKIKERERQKELEALKVLFEESDSDGSGVMNKAEFIAACTSEKAQAQFEALDLPVDGAEELFEILDADHSDQLSIEEFIAGCIKLRSAATASMSLMFDVKAVKSRIKRLEGFCGAQDAQAEQQWQESVQQMKSAFGAVDKDGNGQLDREEFATLCSGEALGEQLTKFLANLELVPEECSSLFTLLDEDGSGSLGIEEFLQGTRKLKGAARARDMMELKAGLQTLKYLCGASSASEELVWSNQKARLLVAFQKVDSDGDGQVDLGEFVRLCRGEVSDIDDELREFIAGLKINEAPGEAREVFEILDHDQDGKLNIDEFLEGSRRLRGAARAKDQVFLRRDVSVLLERARTMRWGGTAGGAPGVSSPRPGLDGLGPRAASAILDAKLDTTLKRLDEVDARGGKSLERISRLEREVGDIRSAVVGVGVKLDMLLEKFGGDGPNVGKPIGGCLAFRASAEPPPEPPRRRGSQSESPRESPEKPLRNPLRGQQRLERRG